MLHQQSAGTQCPAILVFSKLTLLISPPTLLTHSKLVHRISCNLLSTGAGEYDYWHACTTPCLRLTGTRQRYHPERLSPRLISEDGVAHDVRLEAICQRLGGCLDEKRAHLEHQRCHSGDPAAPRLSLPQARASDNDA